MALRPRVLPTSPKHRCRRRVLTLRERFRPLTATAGSRLCSQAILVANAAAVEARFPCTGGLKKVQLAAVVL